MMPQIKSFYKLCDLTLPKCVIDMVEFFWLIISFQDKCVTVASLTRKKLGETSGGLLIEAAELQHP